MSAFDSNFESINEKNIINYLIAYGNKNILPTIDKIINAEKSHLIIDNGAFSVWKSGKEDIDVEKYIDLCKKIKNETNFKFLDFIALDKIPGSFGKKPTKKECEFAVKYTKENYIKMKKEFGGNALPVFHQHDDFSYLDFYLDENDFICISPANDETNKGREVWLDRVFEKIDVKNSKVKTHGLAVTGKYLCEKYPFYSVDSSTWNVPSVYGRVNAWKKFKMINLERPNIFDSVLSAFQLKGIFFPSKEDNSSIKTSIDTFLELEDYITRLWVEKGIVWN